MQLASGTAAELAKCLTFDRAAEFSSLSIGLMQRAVRAMLDLLMKKNRRGTLPFSGSSEAINPAAVAQKHDWFPAKAVKSWRLQAIGTDQTSQQSPPRPCRRRSSR
jgi:hypothetical protein